MMLIGHAVISLRNSPCDACKSVAIAAEGSRFSNRLLVTLGFQEAGDRLRHRSLTRYIEMIPCSNAIDGLVKIISDSFFDLFFWLGLVDGESREEYGHCRGLRSFYPFDVIMRDFGASLGALKRLLKFFIPQSPPD